MTELLTAKQVAEALNLSQHHIRLLSKTGRLPFRTVKLGKTYRFPKDEVVAYINGEPQNEQK